MMNRKIFQKSAFLLVFSVLVGIVFLNMQVEKPFSERPEVQAFIQEMVAKEHFDVNWLTHVLNTVHKRPDVLTKIQHPTEEETAWLTYKKALLTEDRIQKGIQFWRAHKEPLAKAEKVYGIPESIIVAIIGVETLYGRRMGKFPVLDALANIAFSDVPRHDFFKAELKEFLLLCRERHMDPFKPVGSCAGTIGQPQFLPSSFRRYAVDFSQTGQIDLTDDDTDVIGSIANYLRGHGWKRRERIVVPARKDESSPMRLPINLLEGTVSRNDLQYTGLFPLVSIPEGERLGVIQLIEEEGPTYWVGLPNMYVLARYNGHLKYGMAVYLLSQELTKRM